MGKINPNLIKLAELTHNPDLKVDESILEEKVDIETSNALNLEDYIYIPSIDLYVAKERTLNGKNWYETHEELHKQGLQMLTIPEFIKFIKYLKRGIRHPRYQNRKDSERILDEILTVRNPLRGEWLDANFQIINEKLYINYNHRTINGELKPLNSEPLKNCLMQNKFYDTKGIDLDHWLKHPTKQGLPQRKTQNGEMGYWYPKENCVAGFIADSGVAGLSCRWGPSSQHSSLGVHAAKTTELK